MMHLRYILPITFILFSAELVAQNKKLDQILQGFNWTRHSCDAFNIYVEEGQYADSSINVVCRILRADQGGVVKFLGKEQFLDTPSIVIFDTRESISTVLGFDAQGYAIPENKVVVFLHNRHYSLISKHELTHYYAFLIWGRPADNWFSEGLAAHYDNEWNGHQIDSLAKHLKDNRRLFKMPGLFKEFFKKDPMIAYPQLGSFTGFLLANYGMDKIKEIWISGVGLISSVYGKSLRKLEQEWLGELDKIVGVQIEYSSYLK